MATTGLLSAASPLSRPSSLTSAEVWGFHSHTMLAWKTPSKQMICSANNRQDECTVSDGSYASQRVDPGVLRREALFLSTTLLATSVSTCWKDEGALASDYVDSMSLVSSFGGCLCFFLTPVPALRGKDYGKPKMRYPDYTLTESGLQFKDLRLGTGATPKEGETVVVDWDGYTIGYYGRIFEARNKPKGGSFEGNEKGYLRFRLGTREVIPAFEEAILTMSLGGVRRIIVPPELGYPDNDFNKKGPRPTTFSGQRALAFVLENQNLIDKTLLFDIELLKIAPT